MCICNRFMGHMYKGRATVGGNKISQSMHTFWLNANFEHMFVVERAQWNKKIEENEASENESIEFPKLNRQTTMCIHICSCHLMFWLKFLQSLFINRSLINFSFHSYILFVFILTSQVLNTLRMSYSIEWIDEIFGAAPRMAHGIQSEQIK